MRAQPRLRLRALREREREVQDTPLGRAAPQRQSRGPGGRFEASQKQRFQVGVICWKSAETAHTARKQGGRV